MDTIEEEVLLYWPSLAGVLLIVLVHLFAPRFHFMRKPQNVWVPMSAGVALAYVFMDIFPHLAKSKARLAYTGDNPIYELLAQNIYLVSFIGFTVYLGIVLAEIAYRKTGAGSDVTFRDAPIIVKIEILSLTGYSFLIGYILSEQVTHRAEPAMLFGAAMAIHFIGLDELARGHFPKVYDQFMRFASALAVIAGWVAGVAFEISDAALDVWFAFLAGGIIVLATVYELPHIHTQRQYWAFIGGAAVFSGLLLAMGIYDT